MKELYINDNYHIQIDPDTKEISSPISDSYGVKRMYAIQEPTHITYRCGEVQHRADANTGDVVCILYHKDYKQEMIVIKNEQLYDNIIDKHARYQREKEIWAESKKRRKQ
jgi:hypothetical protein